MKYRCIKDNFLWKKGAILHQYKSSEGYAYYKPDDDRFCSLNAANEVISAPIVESSPEWFEPIEDRIWEKFNQKVKNAVDRLYLKMHKEWRNGS